MSSNSGGRFVRTKHCRETTVPEHWMSLAVASQSYPDPEYEGLTVNSWLIGVAAYTRRQRGVYRKPTYHVCYQPEQLWSVIDNYQSERRPVWVFVDGLYNAMSLAGFWKQLEEGRFSISGTEPNSRAAPMSGKRSWRGVVATSPTASFTVARGVRGTVKFVELSNYVNATRRVLGETVGVQHLPKPSITEPIAAHEEWCIGECTITHLAMDKALTWWANKGVGKWATTVPQMAMSSYQTIEDHGMPIVDRQGSSKDLERDCYYGGRTLVGFQGVILPCAKWTVEYADSLDRMGVPYTGGPVVMIDARSHYAGIMAKGKYPVRRALHRSEMHPIELSKALRLYDGCAWCEVQSDSIEYPLRTLNGTVYATGHFWTALCGPELRRASDQCNIRRVGEVALYECRDIFSSWANHWWTERLAAESAGDSLRAKLVKSILCSLYGKWAQMQPTWEVCADRTASEPWESWTEYDESHGSTEHYRSIAWTVQRLNGLAHKERSFPAISAFIAAYGRECIRSLILKLPPRSVYYSATDSLILTPEAFFRVVDMGLLDNSAMGGMALKGQYDEAAIYGPGHYRLGSTLVCSGVEDDCVWVSPVQYTVEHIENVYDVWKRRPDGTLHSARVTMPLPVRPTCEIVTREGWTHPPVVLSPGRELPPRAVDGLRRAAVSIQQSRPVALL